jgi:hypothetical protein
MPLSHLAAPTAKTIKQLHEVALSYAVDHHDLAAEGTSLARSNEQPWL